MLAAEKSLIKKKKNLSPIGIKWSAPLEAYILSRYRYNPHEVEVKIWDAVTDMTLIEYKDSVVTLYKYTHIDQTRSGKFYISLWNHII